MRYEFDDFADAQNPALDWLTCRRASLVHASEICIEKRRFHQGRADDANIFTSLADYSRTAVAKRSASIRSATP
jgi:hypothetical protein